MNEDSKWIDLINLLQDAESLSEYLSDKYSNAESEYLEIKDDIRLVIKKVIRLY